MAEQDALGFDLQARVETVVIEELEAQRMQCRAERDVGIVRDGLAQRQCAMRCELRRQPVRQGPIAIILLGRVDSSIVFLVGIRSG